MKCNQKYTTRQHYNSDTWIVTAAWPTINDVPHLGTILQLLTGDVITRSLRLAGEKVISVTGSDAHGTPILIGASKNGQDPVAFVHDLHERLVGLLEHWKIHYDHYTITTTPSHKRFVQSFYNDLNARKLLFAKETTQFFCPTCSRFLPDRFVEGECPKCHQTPARGDQCPNGLCGAILDPEELKNPYCKECGSPPEQRATTHFFFDLQPFSKPLQEFLDKVHCPNNVIEEARTIISSGLQPRPITRDLIWGIDASNLGPKASGKVYYVWAEDVLGYLSASIKPLGKEWENVWTDRRTRTVFCLGIDNLFFHAIWFPALLLASSTSFVLPHALVVSQFLQFEGHPFSKSLNRGIWVDQALELAPADYWRFYLTYTRPEGKGHNFTWEQFTKVINSELIDTVGNLTRRVSVLAVNFLGGTLDLSFRDREHLKEFLGLVSQLITDYRLLTLKLDIKKALVKTLELASLSNSFLNQSSPWNEPKEDIRVTTISAVVCTTGWVGYLLSPVCPDISSRILNQVGFHDPPKLNDWAISNNLLESFGGGFANQVQTSSFFLEKLDLGHLKTSYERLK